MFENHPFKVEAHIHSLDGKLGEATIIKKMEGHDNKYLAEYNGVQCTAIFNGFVGRYYVDDKYGIIPNEAPKKEHIVNVGYRIFKMSHFEDGRGYALGYSEKAKQYVTWYFMENGTEKPDFNYGHYIKDKKDAERDFERRTQYRMGDYDLSCTDDNGMAIEPNGTYLPGSCLSVSNLDGSLIYITRDEKGFRPAGDNADPGHYRAHADRENEADGVTKAQEAAMVHGSMFGWNTPGADPRNYDENGRAIKPKKRNEPER